MKVLTLLRKTSLCTTGLFVFSIFANIFSDVDAKTLTKEVIVVCAERDIPDGATIGLNDVGEVKVAETALPAGVPALNAKASRDSTYYLNSKIEAVGRISKGVRKGQMLFFSYPGYRGCTVVLALKDIPRGLTIQNDCITETEINPCKIPVWAISSKEGALGKRSSGIQKGQVICYESGDSKECGGEFPARGAGYTSQYCYYAVRKITAGSTIKAADVRLRSFRFITKSANHHEDFSRRAEGRRSRLDIAEGQIISERDLVPEKRDR